jgi:hypothetical protein
MHPLVLATLVAVVSTGTAAQMTGGPGGAMSTSAYFPLVDGARYEYVFQSGPHATATAVMHGGQSWAGMSNVTGIHMTLACKDATPCVMDVDDFYSMGPDGVRWHGGRSSTPDGSPFMTSLNPPEWRLKNPVVPGTMMGGGMGYQIVEQWQGPVSGMNSMTGRMDYAGMYQAMGLETVVTPAGTFVDCLHVREQGPSGRQRDVWYARDVGIVRWIDDTEEAVLAAVRMPTAPAARVAYAVEYYHARLDHYFVTASPLEIAAMDRGDFQGWQRTGLGFYVVDPADTSPTATVPVCRFYGRPEAGLDSHFYSGSASECELVRQKWPTQWSLESSDAFRMLMPDSAGRCPAETLPVYRSWNGRSDANHRFTTDASLHRSMMGRGSVAEGSGDPPVGMCSPM